MVNRNSQRRDFVSMGYPPLLTKLIMAFVLHNTEQVLALLAKQNYIFRMRLVKTSSSPAASCRNKVSPLGTAFPFPCVQRFEQCLILKAA